MDGTAAVDFLRDARIFAVCGGDEVGGAEAGADAADRHLFARIVGFATNPTHHPDTVPTEELGLSKPALTRLIDRFLPGWQSVLAGLPDDAEPGEDAIEEPDVRAYLLECRAGTDEAEEWAAAIVARRSCRPNHLWQDMGFADRRELNQFLRRHFPELVRRNARDMKWKKFLYRELCQREGVLICKSPVCDACSDFQACFGEEDGTPLTALAKAASR
jgi:nitrogen fixation protein NifQ